MSDPIGSIDPSNHPSPIPVQPVRVAVPSDLPDVYKLVYDCYLREGYCRGHESGQFNHYPWLDMLPETTTLIIRDRSNRLVATCSTTIDIDHFRCHTVLDTDLTFFDVMDSIRFDARSVRQVLASAWRLVIHPEFRGPGGLFAPLVDATLADLTSRRVDRVVCSVHPKHERRWADLLGMAKIDGPLADPIVGGAPAVLMFGVVGRMCRKWRTTKRDFDGWQK